MNEQEIIKRLKNNDRGYYALSKEEQEFVAEQRNFGNCIWMAANGTWLVCQGLPHGGPDRGIIYRLSKDFELPKSRVGKKSYDGLFHPNGCDLLDPKRTKTGISNGCAVGCAVVGFMGNPEIEKRCLGHGCSRCIASTFNRDALRDWQEDHGGMNDPRTNDLDQYTERVMGEELWVCPQCLCSGRSWSSNSAKLRLYRERPNINCPDHFPLGYIRLKPSKPND